MFYVIDNNKRYVTHQGDEASCYTFVRNVQDLYGKTGYTIVKGAKARDAHIKSLKGK